VSLSGYGIETPAAPYFDYLNIVIFRSHTYYCRKPSKVVKKNIILYATFNMMVLWKGIKPEMD